MGKMFALVIVLIAIASAVPIVLHWWPMAPDISSHGHLIDEQMASTMEEAGFAFLAAQFLLAFFVFRFADRKNPGRVHSFPGGAKVLVAAAVILVGIEVLALGVQGQRSWAEQYLNSPGNDAMTIQVQAEQFAYYFRYSGPDGAFGPLHPEKIDEGNQNFFGLDPANDVASRDDIVTAELAIPVNREIRLLLHSKDVGHSFYVPELRVQQDFVPGLDLTVHFTATKLGRYEIVCTQLCGLGHYNMKAYLTVMTQQDFDDWLKQKASEQ
jgi:cytochrome c oxidase subunit 2